MKAALVLLVHTLGRVRTLLWTVAALLSLLQFVLVLVARSLENAGQFSQLGALMPPFVRALLGPAVAGFLSFGGIVSLGYFEPAVLGAAIGLAIATASRIALEVETGFLDLVLARPLARHWLVTRMIAALAVALLIMLGCMLASSAVALRWLAPANAEVPPARHFLNLALSLGLLSLAWGGVALALAAGARRRGVAGGAAGVLALTAFLIDYVARLWDAARVVAWLSPFHYFKPLDLIMGADLDVRGLAVLAGIATAGCAVGYWRFLRRDIAR